MINIAYLSKANQVKSFKPVKKHKQNKKKVKTPRPEGAYACAKCGKEHSLSRHHVFYGIGQRDFSSIFKCVEFLCWTDHQSCIGIHGSKTPNTKLDYELKIKHQARLMEQGMSIVEFRSYFGKNYIAMGYDGFIKDYKKEG